MLVRFSSIVLMRLEFKGTHALVLKMLTELCLYTSVYPNHDAWRNHAVCRVCPLRWFLNLYLLCSKIALRHLNPLSLTAGTAKLYTAAAYLKNGTSVEPCQRYTSGVVMLEVCTDCTGSLGQRTCDWSHMQVLAFLTLQGVVLT